MVSISKIGQSLTFNAQPNQEVKQHNKEKLSAFAKNQEKIGYAAMGLGALAAGGSLLKLNGLARMVAVLPAAIITSAVGVNLLQSSSAIKKAVETSTEKPVMDKQG